MTKLTKRHFIHVAKIIARSNLIMEERVLDNLVNRKETNDLAANVFFHTIQPAINKWPASANTEKALLAAREYVKQEVGDLSQYNHPFHLRNKVIKEYTRYFASQNSNFNQKMFRLACMEGSIA